MLSRRRDGKGKVQSGRRERREKGIRDPQVRIKKCIFGALLQLNSLLWRDDLWN